MAVRTSYPGVYIDEFAPAPPIQGVGTSTAAFVGPAATGDKDTPIKITRWENFQSVFGASPVPGHHLWYAVRGFFENGGQTCYVVRVSNATYATLTLNDVTDQPLLEVRARDLGAAGDGLRLRVTGRHTVQGELYRPSADYTAGANPREVTTAAAADAARFRPGDLLRLGPANPRVLVSQVQGATIRLASDMRPETAPLTMRLADADAGTTVLRVKTGAALNPGELVPGTTLTFSQGPAGSVFTDTQTVIAVQPEPSGTIYRVTLRQGLAQAFSLDPSSPQPTVLSEEFDVDVLKGTAVTPYPRLAPDPAHPRFYLDVLNGGNGPVTVTPLPSSAAPPNDVPKDVPATAFAAGTAENLAGLSDQDYIRALAALRPIDDVNLVAAPDAAGRDAVQKRIIEDCETLQDRFGVLDSSSADLAPFSAGATGGVDRQRLGLDSARGYAALYYPWVRVLPADGGRPLLVPPSGHVCGAIARVDGQAGVFKSPANVPLNGVVGIQPGAGLTNAEQGELNLAGINVIRVFQSGGRPMLWGARTTATDRNWQYVSVRRLFLFLEESIQEGIAWAVFEPNDLGLWQRLKRSLDAFLNTQWRDGALFGATAEEAYYVRIDETLNPFSERQLGRLHMEIGVQPAFPAEFVVVRIGIWDGGAEVSEG
ncbi:phage tail sheath subtilisin-like domain-containing protein [Sphaerisporangium rhizosphaerae]|uniref:Phage tail sheath subtilisin-like domain-containing protein n=1 Tax=Sphaerisporangium rhizosphaerae TaxID=2269375 RepID=A0ABW2PFP2_9ACTN